MSSPLVEILPHQVVVIRNFIPVETQKDIYINELFNPSKGSKEHSALIGKLPKPLFYPGLNALALGVYKNIFTKDSNIPEPIKLLEIGNAALEIAKQALAPTSSTAPPDLRIPEKYIVNNCYSQLYPSSGKASEHVDGFLNWVVSISIGDACDFAWGAKRKQDNITRLSSGDIIVFNGGKVYHAVKMIHANSAPEFWRSGEIETYGNARCNIQMRDLSSVAEGVPEEWLNMYRYET